MLSLDVDTLLEEIQISYVLQDHMLYYNLEIFSMLNSVLNLLFKWKVIFDIDVYSHNLICHSSTEESIHNFQQEA